MPLLLLFMLMALSLATTSCAVAPAASSSDTALASTRAKVAERLGGTPADYRLREMADTPLIEVYSERDSRIAYVDRDVRRLFVGTLYDADSKANLTEPRERELNRIPLASIPLERAIKVVKGKGTLQFAVFEDPDCPFCRQMEARLKDLDDYTAYVLLFPLTDLHPGAAAAAKAIWCSDDPSAAWLAYMNEQKRPPARECATPIADLQALALRHRIAGTPTLIMPDGEIVEGMPDLASLKTRLAGTPPR